MFRLVSVCAKCCACAHARVCVQRNAHIWNICRLRMQVIGPADHDNFQFKPKMKLFILTQWRRPVHAAYCTHPIECSACDNRCVCVCVRGLSSVRRVANMIERLCWWLSLSILASNHGNYKCHWFKWKEIKCTFKRKDARSIDSNGPVNIKSSICWKAKWGRRKSMIRSSNSFTIFGLRTQCAPYNVCVSFLPESILM